MTKEYYKKLIDKYLEEDILMGTDKLQSISALYRSDSDIKYDDGQELLMYIAQILIDMIEPHDDIIDIIIKKLEKK